jgi:hypothetical protein
MLKKRDTHKNKRKFKKVIEKLAKIDHPPPTG